MATKNVEKKITEQVQEEEISEWVDLAVRQGIALKLVNQERGWARSYRVWLEGTLWGEVDVIREWGRLETASHHPRRLVQPCPDEKAARTILHTILYRRWRRGYTLHAERLAVPGSTRHSAPRG